MFNITALIKKVMPKKKTIEIEVTDHIVTKEDLKMNPELKRLGVKVGDTIGIPAMDDVEEAPKAARKPRVHPLVGTEWERTGKTIVEVLDTPAPAGMVEVKLSDYTTTHISYNG
jgi:hypothetical protein